MDFAAAPTLSNDVVTLEQLTIDHLDGVVRAAADGEMWHTWYTTVPTAETALAEIERRLTLQGAGEMAPWVIRRNDTGEIAGMTTFMSLAPTDKRLEIGSTWMAQSAQGTGINPAAKLLLFTRAFDDLGCNVVELRTAFHNHQSRAAIARLGAKQDGILRSHQVWRDGSRRDTVVFSVLDIEWPGVRSGLLARLAGRERRRRAASPS